MKDIYEVLRQKEIELVRVRQEVDALKLITPLVADDEARGPDAREIPAAASGDNPRKAQSRY